MKQTITPGGWQLIRNACDAALSNRGTLSFDQIAAFNVAGTNAHRQMRKASHVAQRDSFRAHGLSTFHCDNGSCPHCK